MDYKVITDVGTEPVSLAEARLQCKVDADDTSHDTYLQNVLIPGAREYAEHYARCAFAERALEGVLDEFPSERFIDLPMPPVASITSIKYDDTDGVEQTMSSDSYALSTYGDSRRVNLAADTEWPHTRCAAESVRVRFVTGYGVSGGPALPKAAKAAMLIHIELESPLNPHTPADREAMARARDSLLDTVKIWGA